MTGWQIVLAIVVVALAVAVWMAIYARRLFVRGPFRVLLTLLYRKRVVGLENLPREKGCVIVSNHVSYIDGILLLWMLPRNVRWIVDAENFETSYRKFLGSAFDTIMMTANPKSIARAVRAARNGLKSGDVIGLFAEGTISRTGQLQAFKPGLNSILKGSDAPVIPMWLDGMWGSIFSYSGGKFFFKWPQKFRRELTLYIGEPLETSTPLSQVRSEVQALGARATIEHRREFPLLAKRVMRVWRKRGRGLQAADSLGQESGGREMLIRSLALRRVLRREVLADDEQYVGILLD